MDEQPSYAPSITHDGEHFAAVWYNRDSRRLAFARIDRDGRVLTYDEPLDYDLESVRFREILPQIVWNGSVHGVMAQRTGGLVFATLDRNGAVLQEREVATDACAYEQRLRWDAGHFYRAMAVPDETPGARGQAMLFTFDAERGPVVIPIDGSHPPSCQHDLAWNGDGYAQLWDEYFADGTSALLFAQVDADGIRVDGSRRTVLARPTLAVADARLLRAGTRYFTMDYERVFELSADGRVIREQPLSADPGAPAMFRTSLVQVASGALVAGFRHGVRAGMWVIDGRELATFELWSTARGLGGQLAVDPGGGAAWVFSGSSTSPTSEVFFARLSESGAEVDPIAVSSH